MKLKNIIKTILLQSLCLYALPGFSAIKWEDELSIEIQNDNIYESDDPDAEINDLYTTIESGMVLSFSDTFSLQNTLMIEPVLDPEPGKDRTFDDTALYVEEIKFNYEKDSFALFAGKFNPSFGWAWDKTAGVYGTDLPEDYEMTGKIGAGASVKFGPDSKHSLTFNTFFADTSFLSDTTHKDTEALSKEDGGVSNTEDFSSYSLSLEGEIIENFGYQLSHRILAAGEGDENDEKGYSASLEYSFELSNDYRLIPFVEYASFDSFEGGEDDADYLTGSLSLEIRSFNISGAYTSRDIMGEEDISDYQYQLSAGYAFENGFSLDLGWKTTEEINIKTHSIGIVAAYLIEIG